MNNEKPYNYKPHIDKVNPHIKENKAINWLINSLEYLITYESLITEERNKLELQFHKPKEELKKFTDQLHSDAR